MTRREAAIVSAHTKILCGNMIDLIKYLSELEGKHVFDCEAPAIAEKHKVKINEDFCNLEIEEKTPLKFCCPKCITTFHVYKVENKVKCCPICGQEIGVKNK